MQLVENKNTDIHCGSTVEITVIIKELERVCSANLDKNIQKNISDLIILLPLLEKINEPAFNAQARIATAALTSSPPNLDLAKNRN